MSRDLRSEINTTIKKIKRETDEGKVLEYMNDYSKKRDRLKEMRNLQEKRLFKKLDNLIYGKFINGKIYKITSIHTENIYVGSTVHSLSKRITGHRYNFKKYGKNEFPFVSSFEILKHGDYKIELVEAANVTSRKELLARESFFIKNLPNVINRHIPNRTYEEWYEDTKAARQEYSKNYALKNKDKIIAYHKDYQINNKDKTDAYREKNKDHIKESRQIYYDNHKDHIKEKHDEWKRQNQERIKNYKKARGAVKITCQCSGHYSADAKARHEKSKKHVKYLEDIND